MDDKPLNLERFSVSGPKIAWVLSAFNLIESKLKLIISSCIYPPKKVGSSLIIFCCIIPCSMQARSSASLITLLGRRGGKSAANGTNFSGFGTHLLMDLKLTKSRLGSICCLMAASNQNSQQQRLWYSLGTLTAALRR